MTTRLLIEYDGGAFHGWARQPGLRTVQGELERSLGVLVGGRPDLTPRGRGDRVGAGRPDAEPEPSVGLTVAGRTDTGVHAWGQVASYAGPPVAARSLNALLPDDVAVLECEEAPDGFDARRDATSRAYCYRLLARRARGALERGRAWHWPRPLDVEALEACAQALVGQHDFTAFTPTETYHVRFSRDVFAAAWRARPGGRLEFWIEADTFMRQMNRVLVGTMVQVASGRRSVAEFVALLDGAPRSEAGITAPAHGLYLAGVGYGGERVL